MRWILPAVGLALFSVSLYGQQRPFRTDDAELLDTGQVRASIGVEFLQAQRLSLPGLKGDLTRLGVTSIHVGVGEYAEFQISGVMQDVFTVSSRTEQPPIPARFDGNTTTDFGDLVLGTKLKLAGEKGARPAIAFNFAVQLPNASQDSGLGTDQTAFFSSLLFKKSLWRAQLLADLGIAILDSPVLQGTQTDPFTYGLAAIVPVHRSINLVAEVSGRQGPPRRVGNENKSQTRLGLQFRAGGVRWDLAALAGLMPYDPKSGIIVGATYEFQAFQRD